MKLIIRRRVWVGCLVLLGFGIVIRGMLGGMAWGDQLQIRRDQLQAKLARLQGWIAVAPEVASRMEAVFGPGPSGAGALLEVVSRQAASVGVRITELKPRAHDLDVSLEGPAAAVWAYLQGLVVSRPPLRLEALSLVSQPKDGAPVLMHLRLRPVLMAEPLS